jgi:hypothetical protein
MSNVRNWASGLGMAALILLAPIIGFEVVLTAVNSTQNPVAEPSLASAAARNKIADPARLSFGGHMQELTLQGVDFGKICAATS